MAQRQRVRAARARRRRERETNEVEVQTALLRLSRFVTTAQLVEEAPDVIAVVETRQALRATGRMRRQVAARWAKARATGWARETSRSVTVPAAARADAA